MQRKPAKAIKNYLIFVAILAWAGLAIQLYIIISNRVVSIPETIVRYFSYFTYLAGNKMKIDFSLAKVCYSYAVCYSYESGKQLYFGNVLA